MRYGFPWRTFFVPSVLINYEMTRLICDSCLWIKVVLICFVIESDRRGLRNEGTAHFGFHGWNMITMKWYLISFMNASLRYLHVSVNSWTASNKYICHQTMFVAFDVFLMLLTISKTKEIPEKYSEHLTRSRLSASSSSSRMMCGFECCSSWFRHD